MIDIWCDECVIFPITAHEIFFFTYSVVSYLAYMKNDKFV